METLTKTFTLLVLLSLLLAPNLTAHAAPGAAVQRISTLTIQPYTPFQSATAHIKEEYSGSMGSLFTFDVGSFGTEHISNLVYTPNSGVTCTHNTDLMITCTGAISEVEINFDFTYVANDYAGPYIWWGYAGNSTYDLDYTFHLIFPAFLEFVRPYAEAPVTITASQLTWHHANTRRLVGSALFRDSRVRGLYMPITMK